jgi:hypothetical protein
VLPGESQRDGDKQPPCSPDLAPAGFSVFPKAKSILKGRIYQDVESSKGNVTGELNAVSWDICADFRNM